MAGGGRRRRDASSLLSASGQDIIEHDPRETGAESGGAADIPGHGHRPVRAVRIAGPDVEFGAAHRRCSQGDHRAVAVGFAAVDARRVAADRALTAARQGDGQGMGVQRKCSANCLVAVKTRERAGGRRGRAPGRSATRPRNRRTPTRRRGNRYRAGMILGCARIRAVRRVAIAAATMFQFPALRYWNRMSDRFFICQEFLAKEG